MTGLKNLVANRWFFGAVLFLWVAAAVSIVFLLWRIDWLIHHELYNFGLQFSLEWASRYWNILKIIYALLAVLTGLSIAYFSLTYRYGKAYYEREKGEEGKEAGGLPSGKIGLSFIIPGALALILSVMNNSSVLAFIGLGLAFWGALFYFVRPVKYVKSSVLDSTAVSTYKTVDRIVKDLKIKGKGYYVPPYPKEVYLPEHLKGLKEAVVFVSDAERMPSVEDLAKGKFIVENPGGICVSPPGLGLLASFEKELGRDSAKLQLNELCESLPQVIVESLQLAKETKMKEEGGEIYLQLLDPAYRSLYSARENLKSIQFLGCPIVSAMVCAIAKSTGKMVTIKKVNMNPLNKILEVWCQIFEG